MGAIGLDHGRCLVGAEAAIERGIDPVALAAQAGEKGVAQARLLRQDG